MYYTEHQSMRLAWDEENYTQRSEVAFRHVLEMRARARRAVMEFNVDDVMCVLVRYFDDTNHVVGWAFGHLGYSFSQTN